jgi:hypothetical protein
MLLDADARCPDAQRERSSDLLQAGRELARVRWDIDQVE